MADNYVYKYVLDGEIIYIGKADHGLKKRLKQHGKYGDNIDKSGWADINRADIYYAEMANSSMSDVYESELIRRYKPKYNKAKMGEWSGISLPEPSWVKYDESTEDIIAQLKGEIERLQKESDEAQESIDDLTNQLDEIYGEFDCKCAHCEVRSRYDGLMRFRFPKDEGLLAKLKNGVDAKTLEEIQDEYKSGVKPINYSSASFNIDGSVNCLKQIYTNSYGMLAYLFIQKDSNVLQGIIYSHPGSEKRNHADIIRAWENRGSNRYFKTELVEQMMGSGRIDELLKGEEDGNA